MTENARVLVTAFEPFGGQAVNASQLALRAMAPENLLGVELIRAELPVVFGESLQALRSHIRRSDPQLVVCLGQAGGRRAITVERVAINIDDARIEDNLGARPIDEPIARSGPVAYWSTLPIKAIAQRLSDAGHPTEVSQTAGTFVCNHVFYGLMRTLKRRRQTRGGFVHLPFETTQLEAGDARASMARGDVARALELLIDVSLTTPVDARIAGGATH